MKVSIFNLRLSEECCKKDQQVINRFIKHYQILHMEYAFVNEQEKYWSIIVQYEEDAYKEGLQKKNIDFIGEPIDTLWEEKTLKALKNWRAQKAKQQKIPTYFIATNQQISEIVSLHPSKKEDLLQVKGFGKYKLENYGQEIILVIHGSLSIEESNSVQYIIPS